MTLERIGPIMQVAYLVPDLDKAVARWQAQGVGPFFVTRHPKYVLQEYRGQLRHCDFSAGFAFNGELQIELIEQHDDTPSPYTEFLAEHGYGVHHLGVLSHDLARDSSLIAARGGQLSSRMVSAIGVETRLFDVDHLAGASLELIQATEAVQVGMATMKQMAQTWDGQSTVIEF